MRRRFWRTNVAMGAVNKTTGKAEMWNECYLHSDDEIVNAQLEKLEIWDERTQKEWLTELDNRRKIDESKTMEIFYLKEEKKCREVMN